MLLAINQSATSLVPPADQSKQSDCNQFFAYGLKMRSNAICFAEQVG